MAAVYSGGGGGGSSVSLSSAGQLATRLASTWHSSLHTEINCSLKYFPDHLTWIFAETWNH